MNHVTPSIPPQHVVEALQDPFGSLLAKAKGSVLIGVQEVMEAAEALEDLT